MDTTHSDTSNNNNVLVERESEGRLNLKKRHENDADEVRESYSLYSSTNIFSSHKIFLCCRLCTKSSSIWFLQKLLLVNLRDNILGFLSFQESFSSLIWRPNIAQGSYVVMFPFVSSDLWLNSNNGRSKARVNVCIQNQCFAIIRLDT